MGTEYAAPPIRSQLLVTESSSGNNLRPEVTRANLEAFEMGGIWPLGQQGGGYNETWAREMEIARQRQRDLALRLSSRPPGSSQAAERIVELELDRDLVRGAFRGGSDSEADPELSDAEVANIMRILGLDLSSIFSPVNPTGSDGGDGVRAEGEDEKEGPAGPNIQEAQKRGPIEKLDPVINIHHVEEDDF